MATWFGCGLSGRLLSFVVALAFPLSAVKATGNSRVLGLYVGVAQYQFARDRFPGGTLRDLAAAPTDVRTISSALGPRVQIKSTKTLLGPEATREQILTALRDLIESASAGDTLLFYYSGHGARVQDKIHSQFSAFSSTVVPFDAREPGNVRAGTPGDILDSEIGPMIAAAASAGVNVVTIFDSCSSGTATRSPFRSEGEVRTKFAPDIKAVPRTMSLPRVRPASKQGYVVHLAAVPDGALAIERLVENVWRSDFTAALASTLPALPTNATYRDWLNAARVAMVLDGTTPRPVGEGALDQPLFGDARLPSGIVEGERTGATLYQVKGGAIAGVRPGSEFAAFATSGDAVSGADELGRARVTAVTPFSAKFEFPNSDGAMPATIYLREERRAPSAARLRVQVIGNLGKARLSVEQSLARLNLIEQVTNNPQIGLVVDGNSIEFLRADGSLVTKVAAADESSIRSTLESVARYHGLLELQGEGAALPVKLEIANVDCQGQQALPFSSRSSEPILRPWARENRFHLVVRNDSDQPIYPYIFNLTSDYRVKLLYPPAGANPEALVEGRCWNRVGAVSGAGREYFLLIAADRPVEGLSLLESGGVRGGKDPLGRLMAETWAGVRGGEPGDLGRWTAWVASYLIDGPSSKGK